jgi:hypothetical protein
MQLPTATSSGETLVREYGIYHQTRLNADRNLKDMAQSWSRAQERLQNRVTAYAASREAAMTAMAVRDGADSGLDDAVRRFYGALLAKTNNNRKAPLFGVYFPEGLGAMVDAPMEAEIQKVSVLLSKLEQEEDEALKSHAGPIAATMTGLIEAVDAHRAALDASLQAFGLVEMEKVNWFDSYKLNHRRLAQIYYQNPKKADTYFKPAARAKKARPAPTEGTSG